MPIYHIPDELIFPPQHHAEGDGLLGIGGDLSPQRLLLAYESGIFPWFSEGDPILWWCPDPRFVLYPSKVKLSKSMKQVLRRKLFDISYDQAFDQVIAACKLTYRPGQSGTWITDEMEDAYKELHKIGLAHSVEVWQDKKLVGGLYGVSLGKCFFGESMFAHVSNASKAGFLTLVKELEERDFRIIDCQVYTPHLESLGAEYLSRSSFLDSISPKTGEATLKGNWGELMNRVKPF